MLAKCIRDCFDGKGQLFKTTGGPAGNGEYDIDINAPHAKHFTWTAKETPKADAVKAKAEETDDAKKAREEFERLKSENAKLRGKV